MHNVFIYGTLKRGFPNHGAGMANARFVGRFRTLRAYPLVVGGQWFSPYLIDEPGEGHRVFGEVFEVDSDGLKALDVLEGTRLPNGYRRIAVAVQDVDDARALDAWTYAKDRAAVGPIHADPMDEYRLDPRYIVPSKRPAAF